MRRKLERRLIKALGIWQIVDGVITILFYGISQKRSFLGVYDYSSGYGKGMNAMIDNIFIFITLFGSLLIGLGLFHLVLANKYVKDNKINKKIGWWLFFQSALSYLILDIPSLILGIMAAIIYMAKNKRIQLEVENQTSIH